MSTLPERVYKVVPAALWTEAEATGRFRGAPVDLADGYIHLSTAAQLPETLARHFAGRGELLLLALDTAALGPALRWEVSRGGDMFPHLYRDLDHSEVLWSAPIAVAANGDCDLPGAVR